MDILETFSCSWILLVFQRFSEYGDIEILIGVSGCILMNEVFRFLLPNTYVFIYADDTY